MDVIPHLAHMSLLVSLNCRYATVLLLLPFNDVIAMVASYLPADISSLKVWLMSNMHTAAGAAAHGSSPTPEAELALRSKMYQRAALCSRVALQAQVQLCFEGIIKNLDLQDLEVCAVTKAQVEQCGKVA